MRKKIKVIPISKNKILILKNTIILGGKHRFYCTNCHTKFHSWNPKMGIKGWKEMMPKCSRCHGWPHGPKLTNCMSCHTDPHAIKKPMTLTKILKINCKTCHIKVSSFMKTHVTKHFIKVKCYDCHHDVHGYIPKCLECHEGHAPGQTTSSSCLECHGYEYIEAGEIWKAPHAPVPVTYANNLPNENCAPCHMIVYNHLSQSLTKHRNVACVACHHNKHGYIPDCTECHGKYPHGMSFHKLYSNCLYCHINPHDPISKNNLHSPNLVRYELQREKKVLNILRRLRNLEVPLKPEILKKLPEF